MRTETVNGKTRTVCRFGYPKLVFGKTALRTECGTYLKEKTHDDYFLARGPESVNTAAYHPLILLLWQGNIDFNYLINGSGATLNYTTSYAAKDQDFKNTMFKKFLRKDILWSDIFSVAIDLIKQKEMPLTECVDHLLKHNLYQFDYGYIFINTDKEELRKRIVLPMGVLKNMPATARAYKENQYDDYYPNRPKEFENVSLFNWLINFGSEYYKKGADGQQNLAAPAKFARGRYDDVEEDGDDDESDMDEKTKTKAAQYREGPFYKARYNVHHRASPFFDHRDIAPGQTFKLLKSEKRMVKLPRQLIPGVYLKFTPGDEKSREDYYRRCVMLFKPWRIEKKVKNPLFFAKWEQLWRHWFDKQSKETRKDVRRFLGECERFHSEERQYYDTLRHKTKPKKIVKNVNQFVLDFNRGEIDEKKHEEIKAHFTPDQKRAFDFLMNDIAGLAAGSRQV